jgi:hypothetical protein
MELDSNGEENTRSRIDRYRVLLLEVEGLQAQIGQLLEAHPDRPEHMTEADLARYRTLASQRDELLSELRWLENQLLDDDVP